MLFRSAAGELVRAMLNMRCQGENISKNLLMAGACLEDVGETGLGQAAAREVQDALLAASRDRALPPAIQRDAGFSLARSGWLPKDLDDWVEIPAGEFLYGHDKRREVIQTPFAIQKYPVTNLQFRRFVQDKGYEKREWWSEDGWAWRTGQWDTKADDDYKRWLENRPTEKRSEPFFWHDEKWNNPLAPVVGVSWFEAEAYANWLSQQWGKPIRLPSEQEWERAARGLKGRKYAWGDEFDRNRLNCSEFWAQKDDLSNFDEWKKWYEKESEIASTTIEIGRAHV